MTIVFAPGFMTDASLWDDCVHAFREFGEIRHVDLSKDASLEEIASRALAELPTRFILVGFSFGGYVAREMARRAPERVQALILIATSARASARNQLPVAGTAPMKFSGLNRRAIAASLHPDHVDDATVERIRTMGLRLGGDVFQRQSAIRRAGDLDRLKQITCPTLVIAAKEDRLRNVEEATELSQGIPDAELAMVEGSGHMIPIEAPQDLTAIAVEWLKGTVSDAG